LHKIVNVIYCFLLFYEMPIKSGCKITAFFSHMQARARFFFLPHRTLGLNLTKFAVSCTSDACFFEKNKKKFAHITKKH